MNVNYLAILASAIASMVIGSIWYGPLFGKMYIELTGMNQWSPEKREAMKKGMGMTYAMQFVASLVMFYVFDRLFLSLDVLTVMGGITLAFWLWIGVVAPLALGDALWGGKMAKFWLAIGNSALTLLAAGIIIGAWVK